MQAVINIEKLEKGLQGLRGYDYAEAEKEARATGDLTPLIQFSGTFNCRIAAKALHTNYHEIEQLPMPEYTAIITKTSNFLFRALGTPEEMEEVPVLDNGSGK